MGKRIKNIIGLIWVLVIFILWGGINLAQAADGELDASFFANISSGVNNIVQTIAVQSDGKILIGGNFTDYNGTTANRIARLNTDGTLDGTFVSGAGANNAILTAVIQPDGKILIGGNFTFYSGVNVNRIARLNADGTLDGTFNSGTGANTTVQEISVQADGKILLSGNFTTYNDIAANYLTRLNSDGTPDVTFSSAAGANDTVRVADPQADGKILIGGDFITYGGVAANHIARLNGDGTLDTTFASGTGASGLVYDILTLADDKILISGGFTTYDGTSINGIARLDTDGSLDSTFTPGTGTNGVVQSVSVQPDGRILISGGFTLYDGATVNRIARLSNAGALDNTFASGAGTDGVIYAVTVQADGKTVIGGNFATYNSLSAPYLVRLMGPDAPVTTVSITDYGAVANDEIDDSNAFNLAIEAVPATGGTIIVPVGTFVIDTQIKILNGNNIKIIGTDRDNSKIKRNNALTGYSMFLFLGGQNNLVKNLTIDCQNLEGNGIRLQSSYSTIENVNILNCPDRPFSMNGGGNNFYGVQTDGSTLRNVVSVSSEGIVTTLADHGYSAGDMVALVPPPSVVTLSGVADDGALFEVKDISLTDTKVFTIDIDPIKYREHNTAGQSYFDAWLTNGSYDYNVANPGEYAKTKKIDFYPIGSKIINSYAKNASQTAFSQKRMRESQIVGNIAEDIYSEGITVDGGSVHSLVSHNILKNVALKETGKGSGGVGGIGIDHASESTVINNTIIGVQSNETNMDARIKPAIHFVNNIPASSHDCIIKDNTVEDARFGVYLKGTFDDTSRQDRLGTGPLGVKASGDNFNHLISGNSFKGIGTADIFVEEGAMDNQFSDNRHIGSGTFVFIDQNNPTTNTFFNNGANWSTPPLVFVLAGQSNMVSTGGLIAQIGAGNDRIPDNVDFYAMTAGAEGQGFVERTNFISTENISGQLVFGPEVGLAKKLTLDYPNRKIIIVKYAVGGTNSCQWKIKNTNIVSNSECLANGSTQTIQETGGVIITGSFGLGNNFLDNLQTQFPSSQNEYKALIWSQGEADSEMGAAFGIYNYPAHIKELYETLKTRFSAPDMPMVLSLISRNDGPQDVAGFRAIQTTFAADNANVFAVDSKDLPRQDGWHMTGSSLLSIGGCYAEALQEGADVVCLPDVEPGAPSGLSVL